MSIITLTKRWIGIATGKSRVAVKQGVGKVYSKTEIAGYYNDLTGKVNEATLIDEYGIPVNIIADGKKVYFPISIFQYALGLYDLYLLDKADNFKVQFLKISEWIINNQRKDGSWDCFGPIGYRSISVSSMGQGEAISVLLRAYVLTSEQKWLDACEKAMTFMLVELNDGGTLRLENNEIIFEEYANVEGDKRSVLNGWIFSLFGIYDYLKVFNDTKVKTIYEKSLNTLRKYINRYDCKYWSLYDLTGRLASPAYHDLHICLLTVLTEITDIQDFRNIAERWERYQNNFLFKIIAFTKKIFQKLADSPEGIIVQ